VDPLDFPLKLTLTAGQRHDVTQAESLTRERSETTRLQIRDATTLFLLECLKKKAAAW
jgi:hypothetical protein